MESCTCKFKTRSTLALNLNFFLKVEINYLRCILGRLVCDFSCSKVEVAVGFGPENHGVADVGLRRHTVQFHVQLSTDDLENNCFPIKIKPY
jgi:hypothetical protein